MCFMFPLHPTGQVASPNIQQALGCLTAQVGSTTALLPTQAASGHRLPLDSAASNY